MSEYTAGIDWRRGDQPFGDNRYSRAHDWRFDGGAVVRGSSAPSSVPVPMSDPAAVDPEEALVAAASSCHMLFFLAFAAKAGFVVDRYRDAALGIMGPDDRGRTAITRITLRPRIDWSGDAPSAEALADLHHRSHAHCYIANSLRGEIVVEG
ncbi:peroxiredoxin [Brevundimonas sp. Leaf363]|uniref:OsmC family protein n=1 Tax=Brevundimonas sp. Leaf363 TaxID=1736353 RepID=UPI0006F32EC3|nr:OsmC family protein [Brevundimonas sp. Leaf363]KQS57336.1 peroxiredoxin [Brevundimonas sp. Leaf363]